MNAAQSFEMSGTPTHTQTTASHTRQNESFSSSVFPILPWEQMCHFVDAAVVLSLACIQFGIYSMSPV